MKDLSKEEWQLSTWKETEYYEPFEKCKDSVKIIISTKSCVDFFLNVSCNFCELEAAYFFFPFIFIAISMSSNLLYVKLVFVD